jgi:hypothetical protein
MKEYLKRFLLFGGWLVPIAAIVLVQQSEWFKEWKDPRGYWSSKVSLRSASVAISWVGTGSSPRRPAMRCAISMAR